MVCSITLNNLSWRYENFTLCIVVHYNLSILLQFLHLVEGVKEQREHVLKSRTISPSLNF
jgi:hypothetical protein